MFPTVNRFSNKMASFSLRIIQATHPNSESAMKYGTMSLNLINEVFIIAFFLEYKCMSEILLGNTDR